MNQRSIEGWDRILSGRKVLIALFTIDNPAVSATAVRGGP